MTHHQLNATAKYLSLLLAIAIPAAVLGFLWPVVGITKCNGTGYRPGNYLAYCEDEQYGDFEDAALYFDLEPEAVRAAADAQILVLGNSRAQVGFSTQSVQTFGEHRGWRIYLMGFGFDEGWSLPQSIIRRYRLKPQAVVINVDPFFAGPQSDVARELLAPGDKSSSYLRYAIKRLAQAVDRETCGANVWSSLMCGPARTIYRSLADGSWDISRFRLADRYPVVIDQDRSLDQLPAMIANARTFFAATGIAPQCAIITSLPSDSSTPLAATKLAEALGAPLVLTQVSDLQTFDRSHLAPDSAERWSAQFMAEAEPILARCLALTSP